MAIHTSNLGHSNNYITHANPRPQQYGSTEVAVQLVIIKAYSPSYHACVQVVPGCTPTSCGSRESPISAAARTATPLSATIPTSVLTEPPFVDIVSKSSCHCWCTLSTDACPAGSQEANVHAPLFSQAWHQSCMGRVARMAKSSPSSPVIDPSRASLRPAEKLVCPPYEVF